MSFRRPVPTTRADTYPAPTAAGAKEPLKPEPAPGSLGREPAGARPSPQRLLVLQKAIGNRAVHRLLLGKPDKGSPVLGHAVQRGEMTGATIQRLMSAKTFSASVNGDKQFARIQELLTTYATYTHWFDYFDSSQDKQKRIDLLHDIEREIYAWFDAKKAPDLSKVPHADAMKALLNDVQREHEEEVRKNVANEEEIPPIAGFNKLEKQVQQEVARMWKRLVTNDSSIKILETQTEKGSHNETVTREHPGFRLKALAAFARLLQTKTGRELISTLQGDKERPKDQQVFISPTSLHDFSTVKGTIPSQPFAAAALDNTKDALLSTNDGAKEDFVLIPDTLNAKQKLAAIQKARTEGKKGFVLPSGQRFRFNAGTGSKISFPVESTDSSSTHVDRSGNEILAPSFIGLGHELGHAVRKLQGAGFGGYRELFQFIHGGGKLPQAMATDDEFKDLWDSSAEEMVNILFTENALRDDSGLTPRYSHQSKKSLEYKRLYPRFQAMGEKTDWKHESLEAIFEALERTKDFTLAEKLLNKAGY